MICRPCSRAALEKNGGGWSHSRTTISRFPNSSGYLQGNSQKTFKRHVNGAIFPIFFNGLNTISLVHTTGNLLSPTGFFSDAEATRWPRVALPTSVGLKCHCYLLRGGLVETGNLQSGQDTVLVLMRTSCANSSKLQRQDSQ